jgi:two-component system chemotaxis response regulator CheY
MAFNVLVVDDSAISRNIIKKILGMTELAIGEVLEAGNGLQGLSLMREKWVDLVVADLNMPDMGGIEMISAMAADSLLQKLPVIVVSSQGGQDVKDSLAQKGVREYVRKPFSPLELKAAMEKVLLGKTP